jgi:hypothetical protein
MILDVPSKLTVLQTSSAHPRTYCFAPLASKRSPRKTSSSPEFKDVSAQYVRTATQSKASELSGHYADEIKKLL